MAGKAAGFDLIWSGSAENETAIDQKSGKTLVRVNPKFYRPTEVELLIGDPQKAKDELGWESKTTLEELCQMMVEADIRRNQTGASF
jgi:GDPmannose 4,6-dehydratase